ncbi:hypothetical protein [Nocardia nepalensis]|uniref:hypothetical protein n=1 Tax=Nocardia nepalensis TaxID=3375448 RepID=UPI003B670293
MSDVPHVETASDLAYLIEELRTVTGPTRQALGELCGAWSRKLEGTRFALEGSVGGVSQAANSPVELIDRMLRAAFPGEEVVVWLQASGATGEGYL